MVKLQTEALLKVSYPAVMQKNLLRYSINQSQRAMISKITQTIDLTHCKK